jgi:hypothetical protein
MDKFLGVLLAVPIILVLAALSLGLVFICVCLVQMIIEVLEELKDG